LESGEGAPFGVPAAGIGHEKQPEVPLASSRASLPSFHFPQTFRRLPTHPLETSDPPFMTSHLVEEALKHVPNQQVLVNIVSKRVRQLNQGERPLVEVGMRTGLADTALLEIIEGKLTLAYPEDTTHLED
jgi:DNA-directed RNA polymerase subunit omega